MKPSKADRVEEILRRIFASHLSEGTICCCDKCIEEHKLIAQAHKELDEVYGVSVEIGGLSINKKYSLIFIDCEGHGPAPSFNNEEKFEFGAVDYETRKTFYGIGATKETFWNFNNWLKQFKKPLKFISDNVAYDWQFINYYFIKFCKKNPFGHSGRRISDFYAGLKRNFDDTQSWKRWRKTPHDHNPVNDAMGNVEAFEKLISQHYIPKSESPSVEELFKTKIGGGMRTAKEIRDKAEEDIKQLQEECPHPSSTWCEECWTVGHFTGRSLKVCDFCEKVLEIK